ncbi:hypothetical protein MKW92_033838 [Papaver armeniacum]|nr:hypothetical protein MKW92_033838 [Papaver armeniacum]
MAVTKRKRSDKGGKRKAVESSNKKKDEKHGGNQLRKQIELLNPKPFCSDDEAGGLHVNKKNRKFDHVDNLEYQLPHDLLDENVLSDDDSEQSGVEEGEGNHARMLQRITGMPSEAFSGKTNITITEAYPKSEFNPSQGTLDGIGGIGIQDLLEPLRGAAGYNALNKRIGRVEEKSMAIGTPLAKVYQDRIDRKVASVVQDVEVVDAHTKDGARLLELNPISVEDVKDRQNHLAKMCSLLFRHEQKSKHIKKRKCKTYDHLKNKDKLKTSFSAEEMDPDSAKELAFKQELRRIEEHMTLRHINNSKWAKRPIRRGLATQDEILTRKMNTMKDNSSSDDSSDFEVDDDLEAVADQDGPLKLVTRAKEKTLKIIEEEDEAPKSVLSFPFMVRGNERRKRAVDEEARLALKEYNSSLRELEERIWMKQNVRRKPHQVVGGRRSNTGQEPLFKVSTRLIIFLWMWSSYIFIEEDEDSGSESGEEMVDGILTSGTKQEYKLPSQADLIRNAFAGDDVEEEFEKEKLETLNEENPEPEKPTLVPGWGQWTHIQKKKGLPSWMVEEHAIAQKKREDALKERKDSHLKHVIISERVDKKAEKLHTATVQYPYTSQEQYERTLLVPLGPDFNPATKVGSLIRPDVVKEPGVIIKPIEYEEVDPHGKSEEHKGKGKTQPKKNKPDKGKSVRKTKKLKTKTLQ